MSFNKFPFISKSAKIGSFWSPIFDKFSEVFSTSSGAAETSGFDGLNETVLIGFRTKANGSIVNTNESIDVSKNPYFVYKKASFEPKDAWHYP
ncbi:hypothetical protein Avbf_02809 [Armadillidium vulgare]|nr:hypothetical protein Avbf_02809 [Armadillidium vulgare]